MAAVKSTHIGSLASAALIGGLLLSGCQTDPGTAATVGDTVITSADVDLLSDAMCEEREKLTEQGHSAAAPRALARDEALMSLIRVELADEFAEGVNLPIDHKGITRSSAQFAEQATSVEESERPRLQELVRSLLVEQHLMLAVAQGVFEAQGQPAPQDPGTLIEAGRQQVMADPDLPEVEVNPRFASPRFESLGVAAAALSEPVSETAKVAAGEAEPSVDGLPANLRCG